MVSLIPLVRNEVLKIWKKKRFFVILAILLVLIPIFTYAQFKVATNLQDQIGSDDWKIQLQEKVNDYTDRINSPRMLPEWKEYLKVQIQIMQYHIDSDVNPESPNGVTFTREFLKNSVGLFLPLMILVIASDLISSEHAQGTIKLLLTRPVRRWKVLTSKLLALMLYVSLSVIALVTLSYVIAGAVFGFSGWNMPVLTGFQVVGDTVDTSMVQLVDQWQFILMEMGLAWYSSLVVGILAVMVSILIRSTAAGMGIMLATLIAGTILTNMASSWESAKYFFMVNLETVIYLTGQKPPIAGMDLGFSLSILTMTAAVSILISYLFFTKKDILN
ncbi:ABC transporter permease [Marinicrinis sediminis]|uniref:ABC transporter permease n=1 Tax=Marinicrinis sediminis TaxID=1652465 RepID=A0ABW5RDF1_9BACL